MSTDYVTELEQQLKDAKKASEPVTSEVIKDTHDEKVTVSSNGTTRTDYRGGKPPEYFQHSHQPIASLEVNGLQPVPKEIGKVIKENEDERVVKLVSGTIRRECK